MTAKADSADVLGARCSLTNDKGQWFATTPGSVTVRRSYSSLAVDCNTDSSAGTAKAKSSTKPMAFGNILFGGVIGVGVDVATGAAYDYPEVITVAMTGRYRQPDPGSAEGMAPQAAKPPSQEVPEVARTTIPPVSEVVLQPVVYVAPQAQALRPKPELKRALVGQDEFGARRLAQELRCHAAPTPVLIGKAPATETYSVACADGQAIAIACEYGNCRALK